MLFGTRPHHRFEILVAGRLDESFAAGLEAEVAQDDISEGTILSGRLVDQSQLYGILDELQRLGIEVLRLDTHRS
jgi:hypothetical protein